MNVADYQEEVKMKKTVIFGALTVAGLAAGAAGAATLDDVKARGKLNCGVTTGLAGFAAPNANGEWEGFDVAVCRARGCAGKRWNKFQRPWARVGAHLCAGS